MGQKKTVLAGMVLGMSMALSACGGTQTDAFDALKAGDYVSAVSAYEKMAKEEGRKGEALMGLSLAYFKNADYDRCLSVSEKAIGEKETDKAVLYNRCGIIYLMKKDYSAALKAFDRGLKEPQVNVNVEKNMMWNRIVLCEENGERDRARADLVKYLKRWPEDKEAVREARFLKE